jgi:hypothetical protein
MAYLEFFASITRLAFATRRVYDAITTSVALNRHVHAQLRQASMQLMTTCCRLPLRVHHGSAKFIKRIHPFPKT